jgi:hypothetical protein
MAVMEAGRRQHESDWSRVGQAPTRLVAGIEGRGGAGIEIGRSLMSALQSNR